MATFGVGASVLRKEDDRFLRGRGQYVGDVRMAGMKEVAFLRSPVAHASKAKTPCLNVAGALDRCTPPTQAQEFHQALLEHGVESGLVIYPQEGHGTRSFPALVDYGTRVLDWFDRHMPARRNG